MNVVMIAAMSRDGFIARPDPADTSWQSKVDLNNFQTTKAKYDVLVMGSGTYDVINPAVDTSSQQLRVVLTSEPDRYKDKQIEGYLDFRNISPEQCVKEYSCLGSIAVLGGGEVYGAFMRSKLLSSALLTVEPVNIGNGTKLFGESTDTWSSQNPLESLKPFFADKSILGSHQNGENTQLYRYVFS